MPDISDLFDFFSSEGDRRSRANNEGIRAANEEDSFGADLHDISDLLPNPLMTEEDEIRERGYHYQRDRISHSSPSSADDQEEGEEDDVEEESASEYYEEEGFSEDEDEDEDEDEEEEEGEGNYPIEESYSGGGFIAGAAKVLVVGVLGLGLLALFNKDDK